MSAVLVLLLPDNSFKRFVGKTMTHKAKADRPLTPMEVEAFRLVPDRCMEPEGGGAAA